MNGRQFSGVSRRRFVVGLGAAGLTGLAGCSSASGADDFDIGMTAVAYTPPEFTVSVGDEVVWQNTSSRGHTVTAYEDSIPDDAEFFASGGYDSESEARDQFGSELGGLIDSGDAYTYTFEVPGTYEYFCIPHEQAGMVGTIVVEA
jgi:plastocyanin